MTWPIKVSFRPNADKELTKEIKVDANSYIFTILMKACDVFELEDKHNYSLMHKKTILNLFESMTEAKLVQGSTLILTKSNKIKEKRDVLFNYRINTDSGLVKSIGKYTSGDYLIDCFQNIMVDADGKFNSLKHPSKLPVVSILSAKIYAKDMIDMRYFTLGDIGLRGNYSVMINYENSAEDNTKFIDFLCNLYRPHCNSQKPESCEKRIEHKLPQTTDDISNDSSKASAVSAQLDEDALESEFIISKPSAISAASPDVPDSFFELSKEEILVFQKSLQNKSKSLCDRPFTSAKKNAKEQIFVKETLNLKLIFPDQTHVQVNFKSSHKVQTILNFINTRIFDFPVTDIELWIGPPYHALNDLNKTLSETGIIGPTRIIVKCDHYSYRQDLIFSS